MDLYEKISQTNEMKRKMWEQKALSEMNESGSVKIKTDLTCFDCPICCEIMDSNRKPITISPCGHTVCSICFKEKDKYCPVCKKLVSQRATNFSLLSIIDSNNIIDDSPNYKEELESVQNEIEKLMNVLNQCKEQTKKLKEDERVTKAILDHLEGEMNTISLKESLMKTKVEEAHKEREKAENEYNSLNEIVTKLRIEAEKMKLQKIISDNK